MTEDERENTGQWAILPAKVRYDHSVPANAKLIYAEIAAKVNVSGFCFCHNSWFADRFQLSQDSVSRLIKRLEDAGYIHIDIDTYRLNGDRRRIYLTAQPYEFTPGGIGKNAETRIGKNAETVSAKMPRPIENNNNKIIPPVSPKGERARGGPKKAPDWKPERFAKFWEAYPCGKAKQAAIKAWDRLRPDDGLLDDMAIALRRQMRTDEWKRGIGIPYASTWLNQRRWEDEERSAAPGGESVSYADTGERRLAVWD